ncbi:hypothetical protein HAX54_033515 [Datura stramonium]|uniref:RING-type E3 ubiquitin transferase n=1 Tax=Datura stramonium TaxID=4076 RepID=A0ABS8RNW9_DATST|nr:hypothetical protein [Datura stramonium]
MARNPYCWTIEHQKDLLKNDGPNLPKDKFFVLCRIKKFFLNYYVLEDDKASLILQENERPRRIPFIIDIIQRVPQIISNPYQDFHEEANEDEVRLIGMEVAMYLSTLEETRVFVPVIPTSRDAIEALEKVKMKTMDREKKYGETCMICFDKLFSEGVVEVTHMPCKHLFHGGCIVQWLERNHVCPLCRFKMPVENKYGLDSI